MPFSHGSPPHYPPSPPRRQYSDPDFDPDSDNEFTTVANNSCDFYHAPRSEPPSSSATLATTPLEALRARLLPLQHIEALLIAKLVPPNEDEATRITGTSNYQNRNGMFPGNGRGHGRGSSQNNQEIFVRPGASWKGALARARVNFTDYPSSGSYSSSSSSSNNENSNTSQRPMSAGNTGLETPDELQEVLSSCRKDMMQLWNDQGIREVLRRKKIRLEDASGLWVLSRHFPANLKLIVLLAFWMTLSVLPLWGIRQLTTMYSKRDSRQSASPNTNSKWRSARAGILALNGGLWT